MRVRLIEGWKRAWKFGSVQWALLLAGIAAVEPHLPVLAVHLPEHWVSYMALAIVVARVLLVRFTPDPTIKVSGTD